MKEEDKDKIKKIVEDLRFILDKYRDVLADDEIKIYEQELKKAEEKISPPAPTKPIKPEIVSERAVAKPATVESEELKRLLEKLIKQKIPEIEKEYSLSTFAFLLINNTKKLNFNKINSIWKDIEYVNTSLMLMVSKTADKKLKKQLNNYSNRVKTKLYTLTKIKADTIADYKKHVQASIRYASDRYYGCADEPGKRLIDLKTIPELEEYLKNPKKGLDNLPPDIFEHYYNYRKRMFDYWKKFYDIYKELNKNIIKIISILKEIYNNFFISK